MAKQTINIGAAPNDGTGTPLRTSFDYCNQNFTELYTATGPSGNNIVVPGSATITGDLTVDTSTLKVDSANNRVGILTATPAAGYALDVRGILAAGNSAGTIIGGISFSTRPEIGAISNHSLGLIANNTTMHLITPAGVFDWYDGAGGTRMTLNSTGLGVGVSPAFKIHANGVIGTTNTFGAFTALQTAGGTGYRWTLANDNNFYLQYSPDGFGSTATSRIALDSSGNVGVGVTPSAWNNSYNVLDIGQNGSISGRTSTNNAVEIVSNGFRNAGGTWVYKLATSNAAARYTIDGSVGGHLWYSGVAGTAGNTIAGFSAASMTLDASGNLLVGTTSGTYHTFRKSVASDAGNVVFEIQGTGGGTSSIYYSVSGYNANAANAASKFGRDGVTLRSINAGGTVNASGADYAEYMVKCSDFVLAKGDVAGIDANGKLTNVFADAVSFVVKSTDPSYVGNDKWGVGLEGADLESARQLVDRIAFAGQVPVNVTGAKAGDYIVPVVDGTGIKGISVSKPTFDQYQLAVGKVIAIDADGRARIIVKVA
jgi:hypothetical protein